MKSTRCETVNGIHYFPIEGSLVSEPCPFTKNAWRPMVGSVNCQKCQYCKGVEFKTDAYVICEKFAERELDKITEINF